MGLNKGSFLVAEDDPLFSRVMTRGLRVRGFAVTHVSSRQEALIEAERLRPDYVVLDLCLNRESALPLIPALCRIIPSIRICVLTGYASIQTAVEATKLGAYHYLAKPAHVDEVLAALGVVSAALPEAGASLARMTDTRQTVDEVGWQHILRALRETHGNVSETARLLGMHRRTLTRRIAARRDAELDTLLFRLRAKPAE